MGTSWRDPESWTAIRAPVTASTGLDPAAYVDQDFFDDEQAAVFERSWVCVGVSAEAVTDRLLVRSVGQRSIVITRDRHGELRGFLNSCRHRGTELAAQDCDIAGTIRCPYHRWGYGLDGALVATPLFDEVPRDHFDPADHGLIAARVDDWGGLLFACLDDDTPPLTSWLGDLAERMAGYQLDRWTLHEQRTLDIAANWKLISENFQEYYHLNWVHPGLSKVSRVRDHYRYQGPGMYCGQTTTPVSGDDDDSWLVMKPAGWLDPSDRCSGRFVAIFPNVLLSVLPNHVFVMRLEPVEPGLTKEICTFLLPPGEEPPGEDAFASTRRFWFEVNDEDIDIVQRGQRGLRRGRVPAGPLAPRFEEPLHRFHSMLADGMSLRTMADLVVPAGDDPARQADRLGTDPNPNPPAIDLATRA